jgi:hypothetical protein
MRPLIPFLVANSRLRTRSSDRVAPLELRLLRVKLAVAVGTLAPIVRNA